MADSTAQARFPRTFWMANTTELFERAAYYSMASFLVIYLGRLGLGDYWPSTLSSSVLWGLVYFLPVLSGTVADQIGYRRALTIACLLLMGGYVLIAWPVWFGGHELAPTIGDTFRVGPDVMAPIIGGILLVGIGGSLVKPCISGTVQKTHAGRATLAFAIFYMVINVGSVIGRVVAFFVRTAWTNLSLIFAVAAVAAFGALLVVIFGYRNVESAEVLAKQRKSVWRILADMVLVLRSGRFALFLLVSSGFWFLYSQVYNVLPLYTKRVVESNPAMDLYTAANPITIVLFQLLVTRTFGKMKATRSIVVGTVIIGVSMALNIVPLWLAGGVRLPVTTWLPIGSLFIVMTVALIAFGELFTASRSYEWVGALAPKGQEGLFLGYVNLPTAIGTILGGPCGAWIFNGIMARGATTRPDGLLELVPENATAGWVLLMAIGLASAASMWLYDRWLVATQAREAAASAAA